MKKKRLGLLSKREKNLMTWASYWRKNPHKFVEDYLGVSLFLYQKVLIYMIERVPTFMYIAARGQGGFKTCFWVVEEGRVIQNTTHT